MYEYLLSCGQTNSFTEVNGWDITIAICAFYMIICSEIIEVDFSADQAQNSEVTDHDCMLASLLVMLSWYGGLYGYVKLIWWIILWINFQQL